MNVVIDFSKDNRKILKVLKEGRTFYLSSSYFPVSEAEKVAKSLKFEKDTILVVGLGNPYLIRELALSNLDKKVLVIEFFESIYSCVFSDKELKSLLMLSNVGVEFFDSFEKFKVFVSDLGDFDYYIHPSYKFLVPFLGEVEVAIRSHLQNMAINKNTVKRFGRVWAKNFVSSLKFVSKVKGVVDLFEKFKDFNTVVIGAGPSLDNDIELVRKLYNNSLIVASDTSFLPLLRNGIKPDIVVSVDPQSKNFLYLIYEKIYDDVIFVCDTLYLPLVYEFIPNDNIFLFDSPFKLWGEVKKVLGEKGELFVGGSVVCTAIDLAFRIGNGNILLFGNDLSFTDYKMYCKNNIFEMSLMLEANFINPYDPWTFISKYPLVKALNNVGDEVFTDPRMLTFKKWIENYISSTRARVFNFTSKGLALIGQQNGDLSSFLDVNTSSRGVIEEIKKMLISIPLGDSDEENSVLFMIREGVEKLKKELYGSIDFGRITEILEENLVLKYLVELSIQDTLLSKYSEESFVEALKFSVAYLNRILSKLR